MTPIEEAIAAIDSQDAETRLSYSEAARKFGVVRSTLTRRHQQQTQSRAAATQQRQLLSPLQESELVKYIQGLSDRALPPTRAMIQNYVKTIAQWEPSDSWISRFLRRNAANLTIKYTTGIDRDRCKADSEESYRSYFNLLYAKIDQYSVEPRNIYNMDEKGFLLGVNQRSKRVFSKQLWEQKKVTATLQDGSREWITVIGCICADGSAVDPTIVFEGSSGLREGWLRDLEVGKHQIFCSTTASGWSNDNLGLAWIEQVFDRHTKEKARRDYRMLILDGHGSHVTPAFIDYCDHHRILLVIFPPHATHSLQPLDVVLYSPLATAYSTELANWLQRSQGLLNVQKSDFLGLFWAAYTSTFTADKILSSFAATGIHPREPDAVLKRFKTPTPRRDNDLQLGEVGDGDTWRQLSNLFEVAVKDTATVEAKQLKRAFHSLQVQNELLHHENDELRAQISTKKRRKHKSQVLDLQQHKEYHSLAVIWSPRSVREARARDAVKHQEEEAAKLRKKEIKELKASATLYKKKIAEEARQARQLAKEARLKERAVKAAQLVEARALKEQHRLAATSKKAGDSQNTATRKASAIQKQKKTPRRRVIGAQSGGGASPPPAKPPPKTTTRGRNIRLPAKYK